MLLFLPFLFVPPRKPLLMVHYMPWFQAKPQHEKWGYHWTMNKENPDTTRGLNQDLASHYQPLIGPYDSDDSSVIECQIALMKLSGIDGAFIDWYGNVDTNDYLPNHIATEHFIQIATKAHFKFGLVYEDRTVSSLIDHGKFKAVDAVNEGNRLLRWVDEHWFGKSNYVSFQGEPVFLNFGPEYYKGNSWNGIFQGLKHPPLFVTLDSVQATAKGSFGWPQPGAGWKSRLDNYYARATRKGLKIAPAFPRFNDFYADSGVSKTYGEIPDDNGRTYTQTLEQAFASQSPIIQLITWNDYGEGTVIEPTKQYGMRDLEATQQFRRTRFDTRFKFRAGDLKLPITLLELRRKYGPNATAQAQLQKASDCLLSGDPLDSGKILSKFEN